MRSNTDRVHPCCAGIDAVEQQYIGADLRLDLGDDEGGARQSEQAPKACARNQMPGKEAALEDFAFEGRQGIEIAPTTAAKPHCRRAPRFPRHHPICPCNWSCSMCRSNASSRSSRSA